MVRLSAHYVKREAAMAGVSCRCAECGFLAVIHRQTREKMEADSDVRNDGYLLTADPSGKGTVYEKYPVCFVHAINFLKELGRTPNEERVKGFITRTIRCEKYTEWQPGSTPKEHQEMLAEQVRLEWQAKREEADRTERAAMREFQADQAERTREHNDRSLAIASRSSKIALASVSVAVVGLLLNTVLGFFKTPTPIVINPAIAQPQSPQPVK
jgi:hypothetical protein